jgi:hypothetical protein
MDELFLSLFTFDPINEILPSLFTFHSSWINKKVGESIQKGSLNDEPYENFCGMFLISHQMGT